MTRKCDPQFWEVGDISGKLSIHNKTTDGEKYRADLKPKRNILFNSFKYSFGNFNFIF